MNDGDLETTTPSEDPAELDRRDPDAEVASRASAYRNWGRWGEDDRLGTLNFIDEYKRRTAAALVRSGRTISLSQSFDTDGPQKGWRRRTNPVHTMTDTGTDAERGTQGFPHGLGGADDVIAMPLQCSTQWDGLGHIFDHGMARNGRRAGDIVLVRTGQLSRARREGWNEYAGDDSPGILRANVSGLLADGARS